MQKPCNLSGNRASAVPSRPSCPPPPPPPNLRFCVNRGENRGGKRGVTRPYYYGLSLLYTALVWLILPAAAPAQVKNVAVVEMEVDAQSGAAAEITPAEVRLMTAGLRREAVKSLPRDKYSIMTSETVQAQGGAVLESCVDENCVITLGAKIGADYIVRGIISKLRAKFALSVEIYETENGNLVASSDLVSSENVVELVEKASATCAEMYKTFANAHKSTQKTPVTHTIAVTVNPANGGAVSRSPDQTYYAPGTSVSLTATPANGYAFTGWSGASTSTNATLTGPINSDLTLTANFRYIERTYTLTANVSPHGGGTVARNPDKEAYSGGERVTVTAVSADEYKFIDWTGAATGKRKRLTVTMDGDKAVTANFYKKTELKAKDEEGWNAARYAERETKSEDYEIAPERKPMTGFLLGGNFKPGGGSHSAFQLGVVHSRPISEKTLSLNVEGNILMGGAVYSFINYNSFYFDTDYNSFGFFGFDVPATVLLQWYYFSFEAGVNADLIFGNDQTLFNAGFVAGAGIGFSKKHSRRYFYRYCSGYKYGAHVIGMWWLF